MFEYNNTPKQNAALKKPSYMSVITLPNLKNIYPTNQTTNTSLPVNKRYTRYVQKNIKKYPNDPTPLEAINHHNKQINIWIKVLTVYC